MGKNKSFVMLGDKPLIEIVLGKIIRVFEKMPVVITNHPDNYEHLNCEMVGDVFKDKGPLAGIHTALIHSRTPYIFVFACDMPFIEPCFIQYMAQRLLLEDDVVIPRNGENMEPLHAIYSKRCLPAIEFHLKNDHRSVRSFFSDVTMTYVDETEMARLTLSEYYFLNVNTQEDLAKAKCCIEPMANALKY